MDSGIFLVGTPADRLQVNAIGQWADLGPMDDLRLSIGVEGIAEQSRVDPANDIAPPPPGGHIGSRLFRKRYSIRVKSLAMGH